jgi:hypothetical protein
MATPTGITLDAEAVIVEMTNDVYGNSSVGSSTIDGGFVRVIGTDWTATPMPPAIDDYIQFTTVGSVKFQQDGITWCYVPKANYLFIQAAPP